MNAHSVELSIILPCLGIGKKVSTNLGLVRDFMTTEMAEVSYELIVIAAEDNKHTYTHALDSVRSFNEGQLRVINPGAKVGKGRDVAAGFAAATGEIQLFTDGDLAIPLKNIKKAYAFLTLVDTEKVNGAVFGIRVAKHSSFSRKLVSFLGNSVTRVLFITRLTDLQCGFKAFRKDTAKFAFKDLKTKGWTFDVEIFAKLQNANIKVHPLKITQWRNDNDHLSGENILLASFKSLFEMIYIRFANFSFAALLKKVRLT